jgi:hypothetical protein
MGSIFVGGIPGVKLANRGCIVTLDRGDSDDSGDTTEASRGELQVV